MTAPLRAAPNWYPDPLGRADYRYWDGAAWTHWVSTGGASTRDDTDLPYGLPEPAHLATAPGMPSPMAPMQAPYRFRRFRPLEGLAVALTWLFGASIVGAVTLAGVCIYRITTVTAFENERTFAHLQDIDSADDIVSGVATALAVVSLAIFVVLIVFLYRASQNTELWDSARKRWSTGWTIGAWFIPLANFILVPMVVAEILRRTPDRENPASDSTGLLLGWWIPFALGWITSRIDVDPNTFDGVRAQDYAHVVGCALLAVSAVFAIQLVRRLAERQAALAPAFAPAPGV